MRIVDTHLHLVYPDHLSYPWLTHVPRINQAWSVGDYFAEAAQLGIEAAIHMEVDVLPEQTLAEAHLMSTIHPSVVGVVAGCRPGDAGFEAYVGDLVATPAVKGLRHVLFGYTQDQLASDRLIDNLRSLGKQQLSFDLCAHSHQLASLIDIVDRCPGTRFILDHCGNPKIPSENSDGWNSAIREIARRPNVVGKISGISAHAGADWSVGTLRPYFEHMIASFGWERVVWGSDYPVVTLGGSLTRWVEATLSLLAGCSQDEKEALLSRNAERVYGLVGPSS